VSGTIIAEGLGKTYPRISADRPATFQEAFQRGFRRRHRVESFWSLEDVSFHIGPGQMVGVLGSNGAGKSTLLRLVAGVGRPTKGSVQLTGRVGSILDLGVGFHPELTGRENIFVSGVTSGFTRREVAERYDSIVEFSELDEAVINSTLRTYSTGMHLRLAFSVATHTEPEVLLVDEVLAVGDLRFQRKCFQRLIRFKEIGCAGLIATHAPELVARLCDQAIWLQEGKVYQQGPAEQIAREYLAASAKEGREMDEGLVPVPTSPAKTVSVDG
jgi:lipopolysaccharide transport system ATP-binding protein